MTTTPNGKFYIDRLTGSFYLRENNAWVFMGTFEDGLSGVGAPSNATSTVIIENTADPAVEWPMYAQPRDGNPGADGADGRDAISIPGRDGEDGEDAWPIPGARGLDGETVRGPPGWDGNDGEDAWPIPGKAGTDGAAGAAGAAGAIAGIGMVYSTNTAGDPGSTKFLFNNATFTSASLLNISTTEGSGVNIAALLAAMPVGTVVTITNDPSNTSIFVFKTAGLGQNNTTYYSFPITPILKLRSWVGGDVGKLSIAFPGADATSIPGQDGKDGDDAWPASPGKDGLPSGLYFKYNSATSGDPGNGFFRFNNNLTSGFLSITSLAISRTDGYGTVMASILQAMLNAGVGCSLLFKSRYGNKAITINVTASTFVDNTTYYTATVAPQGVSSGIANGDEFFIDAYRWGSNGSNGAGVPTGGSNGQFLKKLSGTDFDTAWVNFPARQPILSATADYYVSTTGSDANAGTAAGVPFRNIQKAINTVATLDIGNFGVNIHVADGTYTENVVATAPWVGAGAVSLIGNVTTPGNCIISGGAGDCIQVTDNATLVVQGFKFTNTTGTFHLAAIRGGSIKYGTVEFGAAGAAHIRIQDFGRVTCIGNYTISGSSVAHINNVEGMIRIQGFTITLTGTPNFSTGFVFGNQNGLSLITGNTFSGSATGPRFNVGVGATLSVQNIGLGGLPGNANGVLYGGGQYDGLLCKGVISKNGSYTTVGNDQTEIDAMILHPGSDTTARTFTIEANATVPYPLGKVFRFINQDGAGTLTIAINADTLRLAGAGTTGSRTLAANGVAEAIKIAATEWIISGTNLT